MNKRQVGTQYEELAVIHLKNLGYRVIERNYRCNLGEIDIIAIHEGYLVFIEVKYRKTKQYGGAHFAVSLKKRKTICKVAGYYMVSKQILEDKPIRFDVVAIEENEIFVVEDAFLFGM